MTTKLTNALSKVFTEIQYHGTALTPDIAAQVARGKIDHLPAKPHFWAISSRSIAADYAERANKRTQYPAVLLTIATRQKKRYPHEDRADESECFMHMYPALDTRKEPIYVISVIPLNETTEDRANTASKVAFISRLALTAIAIAYMCKTS